MASDGTSIGKVSTVLMDPSSKKIDRLVVAEGGVLGVGTHKVALPVDSFHWDSDKRSFTVQKTADDLKAMPEWQQPQLADAPAAAPALRPRLRQRWVVRPWPLWPLQVTPAKSSYLQCARSGRTPARAFLLRAVDRLEPCRLDALAWSDALPDRHMLVGPGRDGGLGHRPRDFEQTVDRQSLCRDRRRHVPLLSEDLHLHRAEARLSAAIVAA